jgi:hypothetical protein
MTISHARRQSGPPAQVQGVPSENLAVGRQHSRGGDPLSIHPSFMPLGSPWVADPHRNRTRRRVCRSRERWST